MKRSSKLLKEIRQRIALIGWTYEMDNEEKLDKALLAFGKARYEEGYKKAKKEAQDAKGG
jgi:hypothetical protein